MTTSLPLAERYYDLIDATLRRALANRKPIEPPHPGELPMECGLVGVADFMDVELAPNVRASMLAPMQTAQASARVVDRAGHSRPIYRGLLYQWTATQPEVPDEVLKRFVDAVVPGLVGFAQGDGTIAATEASEAMGRIYDRNAVLAMLGRLSASRATTPDDLVGLVRQTVARVLRAQQPDGTFFTRSMSDNPEPLWYAELAMLHGLTPDARETADPDQTGSLERAARYLAAEVQPDHASSHPLALAALLSEPNGIALADTMLHVAGTQEPATMDAVSLLLLADALRCGRPVQPR